MVSGLILSQTNIYISLDISGLLPSAPALSCQSKIYIGLAMPNNSCFVMSDICKALSFMTEATFYHVRQALVGICNQYIKSVI